MIKVVLDDLKEDWMKTPWSMRTLILFFLLTTIFFGLFSCNTPDKNFTLLVQENTKLYLDDLKVYIEKDRELSEESRKVRIDSIKTFQTMVDQEVARVTQKEDK